MDYYRLSAMARSGDEWCKSRKHIKAILESMHPPIEETNKPLFERYEDRERKMFFSKENLLAHFGTPAHIKSLLKCKCNDCKDTRDNKLSWSKRSLAIKELPFQALFLALMTYLGKVHYIHDWMKRDIIDLGHGQDCLPVCPDDELLKDLIKDNFDREMFRNAYNRAIRMLNPVCFEITPSLICFKDYDGPNSELDCLRFPYQNESLIVTQGFFGAMSQLEILPQFLHESVLDGMENYRRIEKDRPPLFALKSVKMTAGTPLAKMGLDVLSIVSQISGPASDNIITLIACYKWKQCMHFLFPFIELDLNRLLRKGLYPPKKIAKLTSDGSLPDHWLWRQIQGISRALSAFHTAVEKHLTDVKGRAIALHFDLKPANILVTGNGTLKITDFGQSIMQTVEEHGHMTTSYNPGHPRYEPPESPPTAQELEKSSRRGVKDIAVLLNYDVWSLACIMIEVLIHLLDTQPLDAFDEKLEMEPFGRFWTGNDLKQGVVDCYEHFEQKFIHDSDQGQYMEEIIQLLGKMLSHDKHKRAHSREVIQRLEKAETNFRGQHQSIELVSVEVKRHESDELRGFEELGWQNGNSILPFSEKEGITLKVIKQKDAKPLFPDVLEPVPCRIRLFSKPLTSDEPSTSGERPAEIGFIWGLQINGEVVVKEQIISEPSDWCFAPTYVFHDKTNGDTRFECRLYSRKSDPLAFIFEFATAKDIVLFQETLLQVRILRPISASVSSVRPKRKSDSPVFDSGQSYVQLWKQVEPKYLSGPPSRRTSDSTHIGSFSSASSSRNDTTRSATADQCKLMVIFFEGSYPLIMTLNDGRKRFTSPSSREVQISRRHDSYLAMQPQVHPAWKIESVPIEIDGNKLCKLDGIKTFEIDRMEMILNRGFDRFEQGTKKEWQ